jgi:hypothetical protein
VLAAGVGWWSRRAIKVESSAKTWTREHVLRHVEYAKRKPQTTINFDMKVVVSVSSCVFSWRIVGSQ